eukprot:NODE_1809_length_835_cov_7.932570_g1428_i0.p1 GENE.NODE_1809_length_835_cov_7.932570_g1428_i0~~NODE_1809_length_835_cov_7.932570_g1428_i0.p1  ORF type:complete len:228 (+),score=45.39 NODE_1809_length_835_cov_7.932570_g1428_i0:69-752(+)
MALKLKFKKPPKKEMHCVFCNGTDHDRATCTSLVRCDRCGEKGHFPKVCPHHTESDAERFTRHKEEKKSYEVFLEKAAKSGRTARSWSRGRSLSSSDEDAPCPILPVPRPFTEEEKARAEERRKWFAAKDEKKKRKAAAREAAAKDAPPPLEEQLEEFKNETGLRGRAGDDAEEDVVDEDPMDGFDKRKEEKRRRKEEKKKKKNKDRGSGSPSPPPQGVCIVQYILI